MIAMDQQQYIINLENFEGLSLREICKRTGHHFNTVKKYGDKENWNEETKYLVAISRKPNSFRYTSFFKELPKVWQEYFKNADFDELKKMLNLLVPIILDGKLLEVTNIMYDNKIDNFDDFLIFYRNSNEPKKVMKIITKNTPIQIPYKQDLSVYKSLIGGENNE